MSHNMFRGGRGGNRRSFEKQNFRPNTNRDKSGGQGTEWVSYKRPTTVEQTSKKEVNSEAVKNVSATPPSQDIKITEEKPVVKSDEFANGNKPASAEVKSKTPTSIERSRSPLHRNNESKNLNRNSFSESKKDSSFNEIKGYDAARHSGSPSTSFGTKYSGKVGEKKFSGRCRLFVANMNNNTTEDELRGLFSEFGETGELFINKDKGFGFIRLDYRYNAEQAKSALDKKMFKGRMIQVRFATHASAVELHGLDQFASNEYIEQAMSQFGNVERAVVVCDDRGRSKGYAIVEFEWKKSAQKVLDRFKEEMFVLGRLPKPVFAKPRSLQDEEEGLHELELEKNPCLKGERDFTPRFISPSSFEYMWAKKWRDLYIEEEDKKARLEQELQESRYALEMEMEAALREQEAAKIREELLKRQEELRRIEEDMKRRQEMNLRTREQLERNRGKPFEQRRDHSDQRSSHPRDGGLRNEGGGFMMQNEVVQQNEMILHQQAELEMRRGELLRAAGVQQAMLGIRPDMIRPGMPIAGLAGVPPHAIISGLQGGPVGPPGPGPRGPPPHGMPMHGMMRHGGPGGPPPRRGFSPRGGERFDHKRPRRN